MTNTLGIHSLVFAGGTAISDVQKTVAGAQRAGFGLVEFSLHDIRLNESGLGDIGHGDDIASVIDVAATKELLAGHELQVAASRGLSADADVSSDDPAVVDRGVALIRATLQVLHGLGGTTLTGALYSSFGKASAPLTAKGRANVVASLRQVAGEAAELGVTLGLEVCNRYETNVLNTAADALRLADDVGADNVMVHLDTYHMNIEETDLVSPVHLVGDRLGYVHIGENHRGHLGAGHIDFGGFFRALGEIDYQGPITFESFSDAVVMRSLSNDLAIWRTMWSDSDELAAHAHRMITGWQQAHQAH